MKNLLTTVICLFVYLFVNIHNALSQEIITARSVEINQGQKKKLEEKITKYQLVSLSKIPSQVENLQFQIQFPNETWNVDLYTNEIRSKNLIDEMKTKATQKGIIDQCATYAGTVNGEETRFYIDKETLTGKIYKKNDALVLEPLAWLLGKQNNQDDIWVLYYDNDVISQPATCGVKNTKNSGNPNGGRIAVARPAECKILNIAVDYDAEFANRISGGNPIPKALSIMQDVDRIYFRDLKLRVNVCWIASSPFAFSNITNFSTLSAEFWNFWNNNRGSVVRDVTHMLSGKKFTAPNNSNDFTPNGEANLVNIGSVQKSYSMSDGGDESFSDWVACASHEIAHNLGHGGHDGDTGTNTACSPNKFIMCTGNVKNGQFSSFSKPTIISFLNANTSLNIRTPSIQPQLNYINITSTPAYISTGGQTFSIINNDTYVNNNTFVYSANVASVGFSQGANPTFLSPNGASNFTFTIQYSNSCGTFYRSIPLIARSGARLAVYPNPTTDNLTIKSETDDWKENPPTEIKVYDELQNLIYQQENPNTQQGNDYQINLNNRTKGKYYVHILFSDGSIHKQIIILEK